MSVQAYPGEAAAWEALERAHRAALEPRGELPPTPEETFAAAPSDESDAADEPKPTTRKRRGLDADARRRLGHA